jgi:hypothetical protein
MIFVRFNIHLVKDSNAYLDVHYFGGPSWMVSVGKEYSFLRSDPNHDTISLKGFRDGPSS